MENTQASIEIFPHKIVCCGDWTLNSIQKLVDQIETLSFPVTTVLQVDMHAVHELDTAGACLLNRLLHIIHQNNIATSIVPLDERQQNIFKLVEQVGNLHLPKREKRVTSIEKLGKDVTERVLFFVSFLSFIGELSILFIKSLLHPLRLKWDTIFATIENGGFHALPIVGLLNFLVGIVLAYQMGIQLRNYGADIYIVDLLGVSILREFGPLITAIIVAGRTGSAFAAEIGTMIINEEIDALQTMGVNPLAYLALPKLIGMCIVMPLLIVWADLFGVLGGMLMSKGMLGITFMHFKDRFHESVSFSNYVIGLVKTPLFAMIISTVGCYQGFQTIRRAESVGIQTTKSVVLAIFLIIIVDSGFSVLLSWAKL